MISREEEKVKPVHVKIFGESSAFRQEVDEGAGRGVHFISNGWTVSAQAGWGSYCSADPTRSGEVLTRQTIRVDCEIAIWPSVDGKMICFGTDTVKGWVPWEVVVELVHWLSCRDEIPTEGELVEKLLEIGRSRDEAVSD